MTTTQEVLKDLYYGNINPNSKQFVKGSEYGRALKAVCDWAKEKLEQLQGQKQTADESPAMGGMEMQ